MKRKNMFLSIVVVLVLLAVYGIWHFSPLRYLTQIKAGPDQNQTAAVKSRGRPVIVTKKFLQEPENTQQTGDLPRPLIVLKQIKTEETPEPVKPQAEIAETTTAEKKTPPVAAEESSSTKIIQAQTVQSVKPVRPQPPQKQTASLKQDSIHPYSLMLSSCRLPQSARKIVSDYQKVGLKPYVVKVKFQSGDEWLRVLAGQYQTRREAIQAKNEHRLSSAIVKRTPFTNLIGTYTSPDDMQADLQQIKKLGYSPYFLKTQGGELKLVIGAFVTREGAENQQAELAANGIQSTVIFR